MDARCKHDISDALAMLRKEIRRSSDARYDHRLHALLLVAGGLSCATAADALGEELNAFAPGQFVLFEGARYRVDTVETLMDGRRAHHVELELSD